MAKRGDPGVLRLVVVFLRFHAGMTQEQFGKASEVDQADVSRFESGRLAPSEEVLRRMAIVAGIDWFLLVHLRQFYTSLLAAAKRSDAGPAPAALDLTFLEPVLRAVTPYLIETSNLEPAPPSPEKERREAEQIWTALEKHPIHHRRRLIELSPRSGSRALAVRVCEGSVKTAARQPGEALELADLALSIAERSPGEEISRSLLQGYCWAHLGNARHFAKDLSGAEEAFALARRLWEAGVSSAAELPRDWVLPSPEELLARARAEAPALGFDPIEDTRTTPQSRERRRRDRRPPPLPDAPT